MSSIFVTGSTDGIGRANARQVLDAGHAVVVMLAFAVARLWPEVRSTAVDPRCIKMKLGGPDAWDEVDEGAATQVWLASSDEDAAQVTGRYLKRLQLLDANPQASDVELQEGLLARLEQLTGVALERERAS
jgi:nucleoside-diphosphate-sugar epimerase